MYDAACHNDALDVITKVGLFGPRLKCFRCCLGDIYLRPRWIGNYSFDGYWENSGNRVLRLGNYNRLSKTSTAAPELIGGIADNAGYQPDKGIDANQQNDAKSDIDKILPS